MIAALFFALIAFSALCALACTHLARHLARRCAFLDRPGGRKDHAEPIPLLGGLGLALPLLLVPSAGLALAPWIAELVGQHLGPNAPLVALIDELEARGEMWGWLALSVAIVFIGGLWDDLRGMRPTIKLGFQVLAAVIAVDCGGIRLWLSPWPLLDGIGSVLWIVTLTNAFNFLDNMDGLLAGLAAILALAFGALCFLLEQYGMCALLAVYAGAALGFLPLNFPRARIFLGDAGSMTLGHLFAALCIQASYVRASGFGLGTLIIPLTLNALPLLDLLYVVLARLRVGEPIGRGDHRHISHRLLRLGWSRRRAVVACWCIAAALSALAIPLPWCAAAPAVACIAAQAAIFGWVSWLAYRGAKSRPG